jgi:hypothetical protein
VLGLKQFWKTLTAPWLARLLRERVMCRVLVVVAAILLVAHRYGITLWPCMFARLTGRPCPGCGLTRAMVALAQGDWAAVMIYQPFAPFFGCVGVLVLLCALLPATSGEKIAGGIDIIERRTAIPALAMIFFLCFGLLRMAGLCHNQHRDRLLPDSSAVHLLRFHS